MKKHQTKGDKKADARGGATKGSAAKQETPAEIRARKATQDKQYRRRLAEWRTNWLRNLLSTSIIGNARLAVAATLMRLCAGNADADKDRIAELLDHQGTLDRKHANSWRYRTAPGLCAAIAADAKPIEQLVVVVSEWLWDEEKGPRPEFDDVEVEALAVAAGIDLGAEWQKNLAGDLTDAFFNLHSKAQCERLQVELLGGPLPESADKKSAIVARIIADPKAKRKLPKCVERVAAAKTSKKSPAKRKPR